MILKIPKNAIKSTKPIPHHPPFVGVPWQNVGKLRFLHLHFSLEVSQFIGIKGIKGDILEEVLSLEILIFMVLDGFKVFLDLLLLLLLIWRLDFWLVGLALLFLFEKLTHICVTLSFSNADLRLGWGDVLGLRLFGYFKVKL